MNLRLHKLTTEPDFFAPIVFHSGVNLILGEKVDSGTTPSPRGRKVNGVGKSLCVEFLHFALLRDFKSTRVAKIPTDKLPDDLVVVLDLTIGDEQVQIRRRLARPTEPVIVRKGRPTTFPNLDEATRFLSALLFAGESTEFASFRSLMSLLMRDERSGFVDILATMPATIKAPPDLSPHLYLLGLDIAPYNVLLKNISDENRQAKLVADLKKRITNNNEAKIDAIPAKLKSEKQQADRITEALLELKAEPAFEQVEKDLNRIETQLAELRAKRKGVTFKLDQILAIPQPEAIDEVDLKIVYDKIRAGLGELVTKSIEQAKTFKAEVEAFQTSLLQTERAELRKEQQQLSEDIRRLSTEHSHLVKRVDRKGVLKELGVGLQVASDKQDAYYQNAAQYSQYEQAISLREDLKSTVQSSKDAVRYQVKAAEQTLQGFNEALAAIHQRIMNSREISFTIDPNFGPRTLHPLKFMYRAAEDGSLSINRTKVFIYDVALMFSEVTEPRHPHFLLHDNIFDVDQDTLVQSLNYLDEQAKAGEDFQYILTLNREKVETEERTNQLRFDVTSATVARFTKHDQFLGFSYQET